MNPPPATTEGVGRKSSPTTVVLHGRRLFFARAAWVALATLSFGLVAASLPAAYEQLSTVCEDYRGWCNYPRLLPEEAGALERVMNLGKSRIEMRISRSAWVPRDLCFPHS
jgi:hypothetical protein